jgi:hypothetical protein
VAQQVELQVGNVLMGQQLPLIDLAQLQEARVARLVEQQVEQPALQA